MYNDNQLMGNKITAKANGEVSFSELNHISDPSKVDWSGATTIKIDNPDKEIDLRFIPEELIEKMDLSECKGNILIDSKTFKNLKEKIPATANVKKTFVVEVPEEGDLDLSGIPEKSVTIKKSYYRRKKYNSSGTFGGIEPNWIFPQ